MMLVPQILKQAVAEIDASITTAQSRVSQARKDLANQEEYLRSLLAEKELMQRTISLIEREK